MGIAEVVTALVLAESLATSIGLRVAVRNRFMRLRNTSSGCSWSERGGLRKCLDLVTSLAEAVGFYAKSEKEISESVTKMRTSV
jgi:hypothetical protein